MKRSQIFIEKYKELEAVVRKTYNLSAGDSISHYLKHRHEFKKFADDIAYCQQVRNFMQHEKKINGQFTIEPSEAMIAFIENLILRIAKRPQCKDICIKFKDVKWSRLTDSVKDTMFTMRANLYTHIPIIENDFLVGVFDENSMFNYIADNEIVDIDERLCFSDIKEYLSIQEREMEDFLFVKPTMYVDELEQEIQKFFSRNKRVGMAFVTVNGRDNEKIQGIITPWDIISNSQ